MKLSILLIVVVTIITSCKKDYTCSCTIKHSDFDGNVTYSYKQSTITERKKSKANLECEKESSSPSVMGSIVEVAIVGSYETTSKECKIE